MTSQKNPKLPSNFNFSASLKELEEITEYLEDSESDLDKSLDKFKRGTELVVQLETYLRQAENTVKAIRRDVDSKG